MNTRELTTGLAVGIGLIAVTPLVLPVAAVLAGPLGRAAAKAGNIMYEKTRETVAELGEVVDDFVAEAKDELQKRDEAQSATDAAPADVAQDAVADSAGPA